MKSQLYLRDAVLGFKSDWLRSYLPLVEVSNKWWSNYKGWHDPKLPTSAYTLIQNRKFGQRTFFYRIVSLWNNLDNFLKLCNSARNLKRKLRAELFAAFLSYRS